jgi:uracil-DNA glycosylase family 4
MSLERLEEEIVACRLCPRLVRYRERVAREKVRRFRDHPYWGRPVPGFGDPRARILIVGLAPAAHGGNRTGRIFTGDRSGDFLYGALFRAGLSNRAESVCRGDGLRLRGVRLAAAVRCAPPGNRPSRAERDRCLPYLRREIEALPRLRVFVALGQFAFQSLLRVLREAGERPLGAVKFAHGAVVELGSGRAVVASYHPSQQNTFTRRLTPEMLDTVLREACDRAFRTPPGRSAAAESRSRPESRPPGSQKRVPRSVPRTEIGA